MTDDLRSKFGHVSKVLADGLSSYDIGKRAKNYEMENEGITSITELQDKIDEVERAVQHRLSFGDA